MSSDPLLKNPLPAAEPPSLATDQVLPLAGTSVARRFPGVNGIVNRARSLKGLLRLTPFDTSTEQGRSRERYRRAALTTLSSVMSRAVTVSASLITVRLTVRYLGTERYGLWMTITSVVSMLVFADLGMGNGLVNAISEAHGKDDDEAAQRYMSSAFFILLAVATLLLTIFSLIYPFVSWPHVFNVYSSTAVRESGPAVFVFIVCFLMNLPLDVVQRLQAGYQEGFATNSWRAVGSIVGVVNVVAAMHFGYGLPMLILSVVGGQLEGVAGNWIHEFGWTHRRMYPRWAYYDSAAAKKIMSIGIWYFVGQASAVLLIPVDNIIIAQVMGPEAVTRFSIPMRIFILVTMISAMFAIPLWPAYGESLARGDIGWIRSTFRRSIVYNLAVFAPLSLMIAVLGKVLVRIWVGSAIPPPRYTLLLGMAVWAMCAVAVNAIGSFLSGINEVKFQAIVGVAVAVAGVALKLFMARIFGLSGVIWASTFAYAGGIAVMAIYIPKRLARITLPG